MDRSDRAFVHVLLFECPNCARPMSTHKLNEHQSLEEADASAFPMNCQCGWAGELIGLRAQRHWVEPWRRQNS
jgi:hypothetical protein